MKKLYVAFLPVLLLSVLAFSSRQANLSTHPYLPYPDGGSITYQKIPITVQWYEASGSLDVLVRGPSTASEVISYSHTTCEAIGGALYNSYHHLPGTPNLPFTSWGSLVTGIDTVDGKQYIGEYVDQNGKRKDHAEAILSMNPIAGETITGANTKIYADCNPNTPIESQTFKWKYWTIAAYSNWGPTISDVWRTGLREYGDCEFGGTNGGQVYNYVFQRNVGLVDFWYASINCAGQGSGFQYFVSSVNPVNTPTLTPTATAQPTQTPTYLPTESPTSPVSPTPACLTVTGGQMCFFVNTPIGGY